MNLLMDLARIKTGTTHLLVSACFIIGVSSSFSHAKTASSIVVNRPAHEASHIPWQSNNQSSTWANENAEYGSTVSLPLSNFPPNLRRFGPNSNHEFASTLHSLHLPLIAQHPKDKRWIPMLAQRWWFDQAERRIFFELSPDAKWSDGKPVTTDDIRYSIDFFIDPANETPWQREQLRSLLHSVEIFSPTQFAFRLNQSLTNDTITALAAFKPLAKHFYSELKWPEEADWEIEPVTGPYEIQSIRPSDSILLRHQSDWWARTLRFFKGRFNVARINFKTTAEDANPLQHLARAELDLLPINAHEQTHPLVMDTWKKNLLNFFNYTTNTNTDLLLLNPNHPALNTRAKRLSVIKLIQQQGVMPLPIIYNDSAALAKLKIIENEQQNALSQEELLTQLQNSNFAAAWITFNNPLTIAAIDFWLRRLKLPGRDDSIRQLISLPTNHYTLAWPWLELPPLTQWHANPFEPFDSVYGGLFWVNKRARAEMIRHPERPSGAEPQIINIGASR